MKWGFNDETMQEVTRVIVGIRMFLPLVIF